MKNRQIAQTWYTFPANYSDLARKSGSMKRVRKTTPGSKTAPQKLCLKSAKNLYLSHRFFDEIRQIHRFFAVIRQILQILCRNQARWLRPGALDVLVRLGTLAHRVRETLTWSPICPGASRVSRAVLEKCGLQASCAY